MKTRTLAAALLPLVLVLGGLVAAGTATAASAATVPVKVMLNGDSITHGFAGDYTWRYRLYREFVRQGTAVDLVGRFTKVYGDHAYATGGWDTNHDAVGATRLVDHLAGGAYPITTAVGTYKPSILISFLGTNDLLGGMAKIDAQTLEPEARAQAIATMIQKVVDSYALFVDQVRSVRPTTTIELAEVMSHRIDPAVRSAYNAALKEQVVVGKSLPSSPIALAVLDNSVDDPKWESRDYTADQVHPTPTGEALIALRIAQALRTVAPSVLPKTVAIPQGYIAWKPVITPVIKVYGRKIYLNAGRSMRAGGVLGMRVRMTALKTGRTWTGPYRRAFDWRSGRLAPGVYRIRVQGFKGELVSAWTRPRDVRVRR